MNALYDKGVQAGLVLLAVAAAGLAGLGLAWSGAAATLFPQIQMPYLVSGAFGGVALAGTALAILATHLERRSSASDRAALETVIGAATAIAEDLPAALPAAGARVTLVRNGRTLHRADCRVVRGKPVDPLGRWEPTAGLRSCGICRPEA